MVSITLPQRGAERTFHRKSSKTGCRKGDSEDESWREPLRRVCRRGTAEDLARRGCRVGCNGAPLQVLIGESTAIFAAPYYQCGMTLTRYLAPVRYKFQIMSSGSGPRQLPPLTQSAGRFDTQPSIVFTNSLLRRARRIPLVSPD